MIHRGDIVAEAAEQAIARVQLQARVAAAVRCWELWVIAIGSLHVIAHLAAWRELAWRVVGR